LHRVGAQTPRADVYSFRRAVDYHLNALGVRLPLAIGSYMRMAVLLAEGNAFSANIAFGHVYPPFITTHTILPKPAGISNKQE